MGTSGIFRKPGPRAAIVLVALAWMLLLIPHPSWNPLVRWSYDILQPFLSPYPHSDLVIVYIDDEALQGMRPGQTLQAFLRSYCTSFLNQLNQLTNTRPKVVVLDIMMLEAGDSAGDAALARAIARNGRVVLAGDRTDISGWHGGYTIHPPLELLQTNAADWGTAKVIREPDQVARRFTQGDEQEPGLIWAAAKVAGAPWTSDPAHRLAQERWLNYYGSGRPLDPRAMLSYGDARSRAESDQAFFNDKAIFIGGKLETKPLGSETDFFASPFTQWRGDLTPGVEVAAVAFANLFHENWLRRLSTMWELSLLLVTGIVAGIVFHCVKLRTAGSLAVLGALLAPAIAIAWVLTDRTWIPWALISFVQMPVGALMRLVTDRRTVPTPVVEEANVPAEPKEGVMAEGDKQTTHQPRAEQPEVAEHTLIRCVGEGAYGQVWIARNAIGLFHAVKVIYRSRFPSEEPYERAFRGIQKFMPISRSHEGFVHVLQVGRNDRLGYFYYVMEAGDDVQSGQQIDPATYAPRTLGRELKNRGALPPSECRDLLLALSDAVERLHEHRLVHRDIKPDNIIFVRGRPKLSDIDLVTDLTTTGGASFIGTPGYLPPEGPGSAAADVYSLGRVLYVVLTGKPPDQFPELPTSVTNHPDCVLILALNRIACKAAEFNLQRRYPSAQRLHADLAETSQTKAARTVRPD